MARRQPLLLVAPVHCGSLNVLRGDPLSAMVAGFRPWLWRRGVALLAADRGGDKVRWQFPSRTAAVREGGEVPRLATVAGAPAFAAPVSCEGAARARDANGHRHLGFVPASAACVVRSSGLMLLSAPCWCRPGSRRRWSAAQLDAATVAAVDAAAARGGGGCARAGQAAVTAQRVPPLPPALPARLPAVQGAAAAAAPAAALPSALVRPLRQLLQLPLLRALHLPIWLLLRLPMWLPLLLPLLRCLSRPRPLPLRLTGPRPLRLRLSMRLWLRLPMQLPLRLPMLPPL